MLANEKLSEFVAYGKLIRSDSADRRASTPRPMPPS